MGPVVRFLFFEGIYEKICKVFFKSDIFYYTHLFIVGVGRLVDDGT